MTTVTNTDEFEFARRGKMMDKKKLSMLVLVFALLLITQTGAALASDDILPLSPVRHVTTQTVPMTLDCATLVGSAEQYAKEHGLCLSEGEGNITPQDTKKGDCGESTLYVWNLGSGNARFYMSAISYQGAMTIVSYNTNWVNWSATVTGNVFGNDYPLSSSWSRTRDDHTGAGYVTAVMSGQVTLWWGGTCSFLLPSDNEEIF